MGGGGVAHQAEAVPGGQGPIGEGFQRPGRRGNPRKLERRVGGKIGQFRHAFPGGLGRPQQGDEGRFHRFPVGGLPHGGPRLTERRADALDGQSRPGDGGGNHHHLRSDQGGKPGHGGPGLTKSALESGVVQVQLVRYAVSHVDFSGAEFPEKTGRRFPRRCARQWRPSNTGRGPRGEPGRRQGASHTRSRANRRGKATSRTPCKSRMPRRPRSRLFSGGVLHRQECPLEHVGNARQALDEVSGRESICPRGKRLVKIAGIQGGKEGLPLGNQPANHAHIAERGFFSGGEKCNSRLLQQKNVAEGKRPGRRKSLPDNVRDERGGCVCNIRFSHAPDYGTKQAAAFMPRPGCKLRPDEGLEKLHGGGVREDKNRIVAGCEHPAPALGIDGLNGQIHGFRRGGPGVKEAIIQPCPYLDGLPILPQPHQRGNDGGHCRGLFRWYFVRRIAGRRSITALVLINGRQGEFLPVAGPGELNLYF